MQCPRVCLAAPLAVQQDGHAASRMCTGTALPGSPLQVQRHVLAAGVRQVHDHARWVGLLPAAGDWGLAAGGWGLGLCPVLEWAWVWVLGFGCGLRC